MRARFLLPFLITAALSAQAQDAPPIRPGLWQVKNDMRMPDGSPMPDMREHLKKLPPDMRRQMEARMKQQGVDLSGGLGDMKVCLSRQSLEQNNWQGQQGNCKTEVLSRSATTRSSFRPGMLTKTFRRSMETSTRLAVRVSTLFFGPP